MRQHREVGEFAGKLGIDLLIAVGSDAKYICEGASGGSVQVLYSSAVKMSFLKRYVTLQDTEI